MAVVSFSHTSGCNAPNSGFIRILSISTPPPGLGPWDIHLTAPDASVAEFTGLTQADLPYDMPGLPNGGYSLRVIDAGTGEQSTARSVVINCQGTGNPAAGTFLRFECQGLDKYRITANGQGGETATLFEANSQACGYEPPVSDPACGSPEADNYDPQANPVDNTLCVFTPKLTLDAVPDLVPLGRPVYVTLHSSEIVWSTPKPAGGTIELPAPVAGTVLTVNGEILTVGPASQPGRFADAETLVQALNALPLLRAAYRISQDDEISVGLQAYQEGHAQDLLFTTSAPGINFVYFNGADRYHSQRRLDYGLWLEVWAVPAAKFGPNQTKQGAVLAGEFESRYRADNAYQFDIAECLRQFTALDYAAEQRVIGYFLRFGETYADAVGGFRRRRRVGESNVLFGLEAVEIVEPAVYVDGAGAGVDEGFPYEFPIAFDGSGGGDGTLAGWRKLSRRPGRVPGVAWLALYLSPTYLDLLPLNLSYRTATGATSTEQRGGFVSPGFVNRVHVEDVPVAAEVERLSGSLGSTPLFVAEPVAEGAKVLTFANGQGGMDSQAFAVLQEPVVKYTTSLYATTTGRRTRQAELPEQYRLSTGLLSQQVYEWLLVELGNTPAVWLETTQGAVPANITDFDVSADYLAGEFSISVTVEPCAQPARGVTN